MLSTEMVKKIISTLLILKLGLAICLEQQPSETQVGSKFVATWRISRRSQPSLLFNYPRQSPVDIIASKAVPRDLPELCVVSGPIQGVPATLTNDGHTVKLTLNGKISTEDGPYLQGGPLETKYILEQMHFHWGHQDLWGSEHFIDGMSFSLEAHLVFYNSKYSSFNDAQEKYNGLAVLSVLAKSTSLDNKLLSPMIKLLPKITLAGSSSGMESVETLQWAFSALDVNQEYYTYQGSLTTYPYSESVVWVVLPKPIFLSHDQLNALRTLRNNSGSAIDDNKRQVQPLFHRAVLRSTDLFWDRKDHGVDDL